MRQRTIGLLGAIVLSVLAAIVYVFDKIEQGARYVANSVASVGLRTSDYVIHELGLCMACNMIDHARQVIAQDLAKQNPNTPASVTPKTTVVVQQKDSKKFVN